MRKKFFVKKKLDLAFLVIVLLVFLNCLYFSQSTGSLVFQYTAHALSLCLKMHMRSDVTQGRCTPLTLVVLKGACLSIVSLSSDNRKSQASCTFGISWYLSQLIEIKSLMTWSTFSFLYCLILINLGGNLGSFIFQMQYTIEWSLRQSDITPAFKNLFGWETNI